VAVSTLWRKRIFLWWELHRSLHHPHRSLVTKLSDTGLRRAFVFCSTESWDFNHQTITWLVISDSQPQLSVCRTRRLKFGLRFYKYRVILSLQALNILGKVFQNLEKCIQVHLDVKGDQFQHQIWTGPVLHRSRYVYINFQVITSITYFLCRQ
jgi:hypothetical protein